MKVGIYTLGCKVNQYETQAIEAALTERGHQLVPFSESADAYIVNTCTVTAVSDKKSRQAIRRARRQNPGAVVAVCGCYAQVSPEEVRKLGVDLITGTGDRQGLIGLLEQARRERESIVRVDDPMARRAFEPLPAGGLAGRTRAMLKVEDGCANFCSYCIIPYARGPVRSLPLKDAAAEAARLREEGYRELVITGIEISSYGADFRDGTGLPDLMEAVCGAAADMRVRLGSLEPRTVTEEFCRRAAALPNLCPQFHLSLQSGCDATLRRMNRKYDAVGYLRAVGLLREWFDDPGITADLIVGFPGETEEEFAATLEMIGRCGFSALHIFPYSRRAGTPAARMKDQVPRGVKEERARRAAALAAEMKEAYLLRWVGRTVPVLFEQEKDGVSRGHAPNYAEVEVPAAGLHNQVRLVEITAVSGGGLQGRLV